MGYPEYRSDFSPAELKEYFAECTRIKLAKLNESNARFRAFVGNTKGAEYARRSKEFSRKMREEETATENLNDRQEAPMAYSGNKVYPSPRTGKESRVTRPDEEIVQRTMALVKAEGIDFRTAMERVMKENPALAKAYAATLKI